MVKKYCIISLVFYIIHAGLSFSQNNVPSIPYGSNKDIGKYINVKGAKLYYEVYGNGAPLLLIHGGLGSISDFEKNIPEFSKYFKVIAVDTRGFGRSSNLMDSISYELITDDMKQLIDHLNIPSINICGFSDGGIVALFFAAKYPANVLKVFASGANYLVTGSGPKEINEITETKKMKTDPFWLSVRNNYNKLNPNPEKFEKHFILVKKMWNRNPCIPKKYFVKITCPVFLLFGDRDIIPLEHGLEMYKLLPAKTTQLCILPNTTHFTFRDESKLVNEMAVKFYRQ